MKFAKKVLALVLAGTMVASMLPGGFGKAEAADVRAELTTRKTLTAPVIDGKLDESMWQVNESIQVHLSGEGTESLDSKMGMLWDNKYLYVAVQTTDPYLADSPGVDQDPTNQPGDYWWDHPNVTLFIDPTLHQSAPYQGKDVQLGFVYKPDTTTPYFSFGAAATHTGRDEKSILRAIQTTDEGWNLEVAIPWSFLDFDPQQLKQIGLEATVGSRFEKDGGDREVPTKAWSAYESQSFWNDTSGYGIVTLDDENPLTGAVSDVLLDEDFSSYADGEMPFGWINNVNGGGQPFEVIDGRLVSDSNGSGRQSRVFAPVQWDDYVIEADLQFQSVLNSARWLSIMFRAPSAGVHPYNQMAIRQAGNFEIAYRNEQNGWNVPFLGTWQPLALNQDYSLKVRVVGNNVKEYIKEASSDDYNLLIDQSLDNSLLERGKVGFQVDQAKISIKNMKVTRVTAIDLVSGLPSEVEALTGPIQTAPIQVIFSDGITETIENKRIKWYSSNENIIRVINNELVPLQEGDVEVTAIYDNVERVYAVNVTPSLTGKKVLELNHSVGYALATVDETLDLSELEFQAGFSDYTTGTIAGDVLTWHADAEDAIVEDGQLTVKRKGLIKLQAQADDAVFEFIVAAKADSDTEYVIYEEHFDEVPEGELPEGWRVVERASSTAIGVKDGYLELDATAQPARVLLPQELDRFGDYRIDAVATHVRVNDSARWHSIMYRVQNENFPYYQMAVRQGATAANGVEFAERTPANAWSVIDLKPYKESIQSDKLYHYTVKAHGNRVQQFIDDELIIHTAAARSYQKGSVGLQANGSLMKVTSIKVSLQLEELPKTPEEKIVDVSEPETRISLAPTVVAAVEGAASPLSLNPDKLPATVMLHVNEQLQVTSADQSQVLQSLEEALTLLDDRVMPALYVHDAETVTKLIDYLQEQGIGDAFIVSDQPELVRQAREAYPFIRGIVDFPLAAADITHEQLMDIRRTTNASLAKIALLPARAASQENVEYLQGRLITVWAKHEREAAVPEAVSHHRLITAGVNGIVTLSPETLIDALGLYDNNITLIRKPWMIGHRGIPGSAPENTLEGAVLAYELGADIVENDIYLTSDNQIVVMHDGTLNRTTEGTGPVEDNYTLAELQQILANKQFPGNYPDARIPSLEQYFERFKETDLIHFVEIKSAKPAIIDALIELIEQYEVEDQVVVITFDANQIVRLNEKMPGMSNGFLLSGSANDSDVAGSVYRVLNVVQPLNATFNSSYGAFGSKFLEASKHRGTTTWPWTYRNLNDFQNAFLMGTYGLTTDFNNWSSDWANLVRPSQSAVELKIGAQAELKVDVRTYVGLESNQTAEVVVLSGHDLIDVSGGQVTAKASGTAYVTLRYTNNVPGAPVYDLYTQPVAINVTRASGQPNPGFPLPTPEPEEEGGTPEYGNGVIKIPAEVDEEGASAIADVDVDKFAEQLQEAGSGGNGIKTVRVEVLDSGGARQIEVILPTGALNGSGFRHQIEVVTEYGTVTLPSNLLSGTTDEIGDKVHLIVKRVDASAISSRLRGAVGSRPIIELSVAGSERKAVRRNEDVQVSISIPYKLAASDVDRSHTLVIWAIDGVGGDAAALPSGRYDSATGSMRGVFHQLGLYAVAQAEGVGFYDLGNHSWATLSIEALAARDVIHGTGPQTYAPARSITRAEFVTLLVRSLGLQGSFEGNFSDVSETAYYFESLGIARALGLIEGQGGGAFNPNGTITRQDMFTIVARAMERLKLLELESTAGAGTLNAFRDGADVAGYARNGIAGLIESGLVEGADGMLRPEATATRAETAVFLYRLINKIYE